MYGAFAPISDHSVSEFSRFSSLVSETRVNCSLFRPALADSLYANRVNCRDSLPPRCEALLSAED